jgi:uncharacterized protein YndB with AHSA1/START domain
MAQYTATVPSPRPAGDTFAFLADFRTVAEWDPSIVASTLTNGGEPIRIGATFDVKTKFAGREVELVYETVELDPPHRIVLRGENASTISIDTMTFAPTATGCEVTYVAKLELKGALKLIDPLLQLAFNLVGGKAKTGLAQRLAKL